MTDRSNIVKTCSDGIILYLGCGGGHTKLHMRRQNHIDLHTQTRECVCTTDGGRMTSVDGANVDVLVLLLQLCKRSTLRECKGCLNLSVHFFVTSCKYIIISRLKVFKADRIV